MRRTLGLLAAALLAAALPTPALAQTPTSTGTTFESLGFGDAAVRGINGATSFFFPLAPGTAGDGPTTVDLEISHSPVLLPDLSNVSVVAGEVTLTTARLDATNADHGHVVVAVPEHLVAAPGLFLEVRFYLRAQRVACEDPSNPALWATVHQESRIDLATTTEHRDLRDLATLLAGGDDEQALQLALPRRPNAAELEAAGRVAAQYGRWRAARRRDALLDVTTDASAARYVVVREGGVPTDDGEGWLSLTQDGPTALIVAGHDGIGVRRAADALADPDRAHLLRGDELVVTGARAPRRPRDARPWRRSAASFAQLGIEEQEVLGTGTQSIVVEAERPPGWVLDRKTHLDLVVDSPPGLRPSSSVQAAVNDHDLGTQRLDGGLRTYRFAVPAGLLDADLDGQPLRALSLRITFHLDVDRDRCQPVDAGAARATVLRSSAWHLPHDVYRGRDLGRFPQRIADAGDPPPIVVLPRAPDRTTISAGVQLCAAIGRWAEPGTPAPILRTADALTETERRRHDLVLVGDADAQLGEPVRLDTSPPVARPVARLALRRSPFGSERTALVVHGQPPGLLVAAEALATAAGLRSLRGSDAVLTAAGASAVRAARDVQAPAVFTPVVDDELVRPETVIAGGVLAVFVALLLVVVRHRWLRPRRRAG